MMGKSTSYNERFKRNQEKLKKRAKELLSGEPDEDEPQSMGDPTKIFEEDEDDDAKPKHPNNK